MVLPYFKVGLEGHVTKWWDLRLGAVKRWVGTSQEELLTATTKAQDKYGYATTATYLGSGVHFGNFSLNVSVDPNFVLKGPNFVSGYTGYMASMASIKYKW